MASAVVEGVRRVGHPPLAARDEAFRRREPPPLPRPHVERPAGGWPRAGGGIRSVRAGCRNAVAFSGDHRREHRQKEQSQEKQEPLTAHLVHGVG